MSTLAWVASGCAVMPSLLPAPAAARADVLVAGGRLTRLARHDRSRVRAGPRGAARVGTASGVAAALGLLATLVGPAVALTGLVLGVSAVLAVRDVATGRRDVRRRTVLRTAVRVLAAELAAGTRPDAALAAAAATDPDVPATLTAAVEAGRRGGAAAEVLANGDDPALRAIAVAWRLAATGGIALADVVDRVAADLAADESSRRAVSVAVAGPKSSAVLLGGLPLVGIALGTAMGAGPLAFLFGDPAGRLLCCAGVVLDAAGMLWLRRMIRRVPQ